MEPNTTTSPPIPLAVLALELGTTVEALEQEFRAQDVFTRGGLRSCTAFMASEVIAKYRVKEAKAKAKAEAEAKRQSEEARERREAARARAIAARQDTSPRVEELGLQMLTVRPDGPEGISAAVNMTSKANEGGTVYEGGTYRPVPSKMDWLVGRAEGGASIGPTRKQMAENAKANKQANHPKGA